MSGSDLALLRLATSRPYPCHCAWWTQALVRSSSSNRSIQPCSRQGHMCPAPRGIKQQPSVPPPPSNTSPAVSCCMGAVVFNDFAHAACLFARTGLAAACRMLVLLVHCRPKFLKCSTLLLSFPPIQFPSISSPYDPGGLEADRHCRQEGGQEEQQVKRDRRVHLTLYWTAS